MFYLPECHDSVPDPRWRPGLLSSEEQVLWLGLPSSHHQLRQLAVAEVRAWPGRTSRLSHHSLIIGRFVSDGTIEYSGFKAVYDFIRNPLEIIPNISKCEFEYGGAMDFIGETESDISRPTNPFLSCRKLKHLQRADEPLPDLLGARGLHLDHQGGGGETHLPPVP